MMKNIFFTCLLLVVFCACNKDDDDSSNNNSCTHTSYTTAYEAELNAVTNAATAYANDPSKENCEAYKAAYLAYVNGLEDWENCARLGGQHAQWELALENARNAAEDLMCG